MRKYIVLALVFAFYSSVASATESSLISKVQIEHIEGGGVGYNTGYTTLRGFFAKNPYFDTTIPFLDIRWHVFDNGKMASNLGVGLRSLDKNRIYGIYAFYDYRNTKRNNYNQLSLGIESIGHSLDARINGYLPVGKQISKPYDIQFGMFVGNNLFVLQKNEYALGGVDAELGWHVNNIRKQWSSYFAAGPYYYNNRYGANVLGGTARFKISYKEFVSLEVIEHYDNLFRNNIQVLISLTIPPKKSASQKDYCPARTNMVQSVDRNEIIPVNDVSRYPIGINPLTGQPYHFIFVDNTSHSLGTYESPYNSLAQAQANSEPNQIIYVFPGDGTTANMDRGITLQDGQKLWGSGVAQQIITTSGSILIPQLTTTNPQITNTTLLGPGVTLAANNEVSGITISQANGQGIYGTDVKTFNLYNCTLTGNGQGDLGIFPVSLVSSSPLNATFNNNIFTNNTNGGVYVELHNGATAAQITFSNNIATNNQASSGGIGMLTIDPVGAVGECDVVVYNNYVDNNQAGGIAISDFMSPHTGSFTVLDVSATDNAFTSNSGQGINISANANTANLYIANNTVTGNNGDNFTITSSSNQIENINLTLDNNKLSNATNSGNGVNLSAICHKLNAMITNNTINGNDGSGISYFNSSTLLPEFNITIVNNSIQNNSNTGSNAGGGITIDGFGTLNAKIESNILSNNTNGIAIGGYGSSVPVPTGNIYVELKNNTLTSNEVFTMQAWNANTTSACINVQGNNSTTSPAYILSEQNTGTFTLLPSIYDGINTGGFDLTNVTVGDSCPGS